MMGYENTYELAWLWMLIPMALVFAAVVFMVWLGARTIGGSAGQDSSALSILDRRYARGEISTAEFDEARRTLGVV